jgi:flagellar basal body rod protein FlgC
MSEVTGREIAIESMRAQSACMRINMGNIANAVSTAPVRGGDPYRRWLVLF